MQSATFAQVLHRFLFGRVQFPPSEEYQEFRYKLLIALMVSGALVTGFFILGTLGAVNPIGWQHTASMVFYTVGTLVLWLLLRGRPERFKPIAWCYEVVSLWELTSALLHVPSDELRVLWFYTNVPGVFILLGQRAGWAVTLVTMAGLAFGNSLLERPYSPNAMATALFSLLYFGVFFHVYTDRSISYFKRMRDYNAQLKQLASHDPLTGLMNARAYYAACDQQIRSSERSKQPFAVLFVDLDHFKAVNDTYGHAAGDEVLRVVARVLQEHIRRSDLLGRIGGEEFSVFLPGTDQDGAVSLAEQLRKAVAACQPRMEDVALTITASVGVAAKSSEHQTMREIQQQADEAMYLAKKAGRNRVSTLGAAV